MSLGNDIPKNKIKKACFLIYNWIKTTCQDEKIIQVLEDNENQLNQVVDCLKFRYSMLFRSCSIMPIRIKKHMLPKRSQDGLPQQENDLPQIPRVNWIILKPLVTLVHWMEINLQMLLSLMMASISQKEFDCWMCSKFLLLSKLD